MDSDRLERVLSADYVGDLAGRPIEEVRAMRAECQELEVALSYVRRLVQGRLDIVGAELARREGGAGSADVASLIERLPEVLSDRVRAPGFGRLPQLFAPGEDLAALTGPLDEVADPRTMGSLPSLPDDHVRGLLDRLGGLEQDVSRRRRALHERIDELQGEITRRYRDGEVSWESWLGTARPTGGDGDS